MKIRYLDIVDWEPLKMRFVATRRTMPAVPKAIEFIRNSFHRLSTQSPEPEFPLNYWEVKKGRGNDIIVLCEFISERGVMELAESVAGRFPEYAKVELGEKGRGLPASDDLQWLQLERSEVKIDGKRIEVAPFMITKYHITIGQYFAFMDKTGYVPYVDRHTRFIFRQSQIASGGRRAYQWPITHITLMDAQEYCKWIDGRLPSEAELTRYFEWLIDRRMKMEFMNECWTSTKKSDGRFVAIEVPWIAKSKVERLGARNAYQPENWDMPFISFRVCRDVQRSKDLSDQ